ncbi:hypothetical protein L1887_08296 [Cichorium endivia]|nr:hypothetical protein L1887_08296 [Cichorium endivia]
MSASLNPPSHTHTVTVYTPSLSILKFISPIHLSGFSERFAFSSDLDDGVQRGSSHNTDLSNDSSYDFLSSELDILYLTEGEPSNNTTAYEDNLSAQIQSFSLEPENQTKSDSSEEEDDFLGMDFPDSVDTGKKRDFMTMAYENSWRDVGI